MLTNAEKIKWIQGMSDGSFTQVHGSYGFGDHRCAVGVLMEQNNWSLQDAEDRIGRGVIGYIISKNDSGAKFSDIIPFVSREIETVESFAQRMLRESKEAVRLNPASFLYEQMTPRFTTRQLAAHELIS